MQVILACTIFFVLQNIQEQRNHACIDQVGKHRADDGNDEEGLDRIAVFIAHSTHVGHRVGSSAKTETTDAHTDDAIHIQQLVRFHPFAVLLETEES